MASGALLQINMANMQMTFSDYRFLFSLLSRPPSFGLCYQGLYLRGSAYCDSKNSDKSSGSFGQLNPGVPSSHVGPYVKCDTKPGYNQLHIKFESLSNSESTLYLPETTAGLAHVDISD